MQSIIHISNLWSREFEGCVQHVPEFYYVDVYSLQGVGLKSFTLLVLTEWNTVLESCKFFFWIADTVSR